MAAPPLRTVHRPAPRTSANPAPSLAEAVGRLCDSRLLDRLVRGRFWIGFVAFALIGIVAMQLALLKMNTGIGHDLQRETTLQRQNADLEAEVSGLASVGREQAQAAQLGMVPVPPGAVRFLSAGGSSARRAAAALDAALASAAGSGLIAGATPGTVASSATSASPIGASATGASATGASASSPTAPSSAPGGPSSTTAPASTSAGASPAAPAPTSAASTPAASPGAGAGSGAGSASAPAQSSAPASSTAGGGTTAPVGG